MNQKKLQLNCKIFFVKTCDKFSPLESIQVFRYEFIIGNIANFSDELYLKV